MAPEVVKNHKRPGATVFKSDAWSVGIVMYVLLYGKPPYRGNSNKEIYKRILSYKVEFPKTVSDQAINLMSGLLRHHDSDRFTIQDALDHPWIGGHAPKDPLENQ